MTIPVDCACKHAFEAEDAQAGGYVACPRCGRGVQVPGLHDPLWRALQALALAGWVALVVLVQAHAGWPAAVLAGLGGALLLWLLSRAL